MHPLQRELYRKMPPARKLELIAQFFWDARELIAASVRAAHSDWNGEEVEREVRRRFLRARS